MDDRTELRREDKVSYPIPKQDLKAGKAPAQDRFYSEDNMQQHRATAKTEVPSPGGEKSGVSGRTVALLNNPYGKASFEDLRSKNRAFVDKTRVIKALDDDNMSDYPVLLRPRRFGKSTFVQMLKCFFDGSYRNRYEELFADTGIYGEHLQSHNTYHVIDFDFSKDYYKDEGTLFSSFCSAVISGIDDFKRRYPQFRFDYTELSKTDAVTLFNYFANAYSNHFKTRKLYVLIDEYANFANELLTGNLDLFLSITGNTGFLKAFYAALKAAAGGSGCIARTFITGVSAVSLDSLTSGFNIALNVTSFECFNEYAGFTEEELRLLIPDLVDVEQLGVGTEEIIARMKPVFDGYCFSGKAGRTVYNSSMCLYYLTQLRQNGTCLDPEDYPDPACDQDGSKLGQLFRLARKETVDNVIDTYLQGGLFYLRKLAENINLNQVRSYSREQILSMLYYLGYLTVSREHSAPGELTLKIPNRFMSGLFAKCTIDFCLKDRTAFRTPELNLSALTACEEDLSSFADSCTEFLSQIMTNQVLTHMNEMALNLLLFAKIEDMQLVNVSVKMQQALQIPGQGEKYADLIVTVNRGQSDECIYLFELKYLTKKEASWDNRQALGKFLDAASEQVLEYRSAFAFKGKNVKPCVMVFAGPDCIHCQICS